MLLGAGPARGRKIDSRQRLRMGLKTQDLIRLFESSLRNFQLNLIITCRLRIAILAPRQSWKTLPKAWKWARVSSSEPKNACAALPLDATVCNYPREAAEASETRRGGGTYSIVVFLCSHLVLGSNHSSSWYASVPYLLHSSASVVSIHFLVKGQFGGAVSSKSRRWPLSHVLSATLPFLRLLAATSCCSFCSDVPRSQLAAKHHNLLGHLGCSPSHRQRAHHNYISFALSCRLICLCPARVAKLAFHYTQPSFLAGIADPLDCYFQQKRTKQIVET